MKTDSPKFAFASITSLFFLFGFITCLNDILIPHLKALFELNYRQSMLIQFCFFSAYFVFSLPAGMVTKRWGYPAGIIIGLVIAGVRRESDTDAGISDTDIDVVSNRAQLPTN